MRSADRIHELVGPRAKVHGATVTVDGVHVDVVFTSGRSQRVAIEEDETHVRLESVALGRIDESIGSAHVDELILRTNHATETVGLRRRNGALTAFVKVLRSTLDRDEALHAIVAVAREADRLEQLMTGRDDE